MKRIFAQLITILLFPQVISAVILVPRPQKPPTVSQTHAISNRAHKNAHEKTYILPNQARHSSPEQKNSNLAKHHVGNRNLSSTTNQGTHRRLCQVH